ncbi:hypothetical protein BCR24_00885 [Enterococcus ureilyticus]|uniref:Lipoprotein n=1 Tax=Enterococcus ureilyticus TaxID=1131292 RepID=A0A1E5HG64_9ENTE|nr:hypothetical protein [Enterococcus ureilyticus]MBM7687983.1 hypothetical protein [Enterococcus ureilyticus]OEG23944.1 hypothetical protein BCR24_00885 [Enterococcus ureilyticus]
MKKYRYLVMIVGVILLSGCTKKEEIKEISYTTSSFGIIVKAITVNTEERTKKIFINNDYTKGGAPRKMSEIPEEEFDIYDINDVEEIFKEIDKVDIPHWKERYMNKHIMDGYQWSLIVKYKSGEMKTSSGSNDKPKKFDELIHVLFDTKE